MVKLFQSIVAGVLLVLQGDICLAVSPQQPPLQPVVVTQPVSKDSDDPAIWINVANPAASLILGTDKGGKLYVFNLQGEIVADKTVSGLGRPNNVDVEYGLPFDGRKIDIAVVTDRNRRLLRVFSLPDMRAIDGGGIPSFVGESERRPMGIALYKRPADGAIFAIVSRKGGASGSYLWQYRLRDGGDGRVVMDKVRAFGAFTGGHEIEAVVVDDELGYVYYADETAGIRKYHADPDRVDADRELAFFAREGFADDHEGLSIYRSGKKTGYLLASDQQANRFHIFAREGAANDPHRHDLIKQVTLSTHQSDGSEAVAVSLGGDFPCGLFIAMSDDRTFQYYDWRDIAGDDLDRAGLECTAE